MSKYGARVKNALLCRTPSIWRDVVLRSWKRLSVTSGTPGCRAKSPSPPVKLQRPLRQLPLLQVPVLYRNKCVTTWCSNFLKALWYHFHNICTQFLRFCHITSYFANFKPLWKYQKFLKLTFKYLLCIIVGRIHTFEVLRYWYSLTFIR